MTAQQEIELRTALKEAEDIIVNLVVLGFNQGKTRVRLNSAHFKNFQAALRWLTIRGRTEIKDETGRRVIAKTRGPT